MTKRRQQRERAGHFTDPDGYKVPRDEAPEVNPDHETSPTAIAAKGEYPFAGEIALTGKAVKSRWPINENMRKALVDRMAGIVSDGEDADSISAGRVMVSMDKQNLEESRGPLGGFGGIGALQINVGATQPADVDFEYLQWRKRRLMGKEDEVVPEAPLADLLPSRRVKRVANTESLGPDDPIDPLVAIFLSSPDRPKCKLFKARPNF
jgi:hypothetical protein